MTSIKTTISVENFIPSSISTSYEQIEISIKSAPAQLQRLYRQKHTCDVIIKFNEHQFEVHKSVVDKSSGLMKQKPWPRVNDKWIVDLSHIKTKQKMSKQFAQKIITLIYGYCVTIRRCDIQLSYTFAKQLQLQQILTTIHNDMITHFDEYEMFPLMKMANNQQINQVIELCYDQLEIEMYEPLRYSKSGCFLLDEQLFKMILKRLNWQKMGNDKYGLSRHQIHSLVQQYCFVNGLSKQKKQTIIKQIQDKQNIKYHISLNQVLRKQSTPRKVKSSSQIFFRNTLTLPREKQQKQKNSRRLSPFIKNTFDLNHQDSKDSDNNEYSPCIMLTPGQFSKSQKSQHSKSISNYSTDNRSQQNNRSRRQSAGSIQTLSDPRILHTITQICQSQQQIKLIHIDMRVRTQNITKRLKQQISRSKFNTQKTRKLQSNLEQIKAEINSSKLKLTELTQTVNNVQQTKIKKQAKSKFDSLFDKDIPLDLTLSTSFGMKAKTNPCKL